MILCKQCGTENEDSSLFCEGCGAKLPKSGVCPECGSPIQPEDRFCVHCGQPLNPDKQQTAADQNTGKTAQPTRLVHPSQDMPDLPKEAGKAPAIPPHFFDAPDPQKEPGQKMPPKPESGAPFVQDQSEKEDSYGGLAPMPKKKGKAIYGYVAAGCIGAFILGLGGWYAYHLFSEEEPDELLIEEEQDYLVLNNVPTAEEAYSSTYTGSLEPGQTVYITKSTAKGDKEEWGKTKNGDWVKMSDSEYTYMVPSDTLTWSTQSEQKDYVVKKKSNIYTIPKDVSAPVAYLEPDMEVTIEETAMIQGNRWGKLEDNMWTCLWDDADTYLEAKPAQADQVPNQTPPVTDQPPVQTPASGSAQKYAGKSYKLQYNMKIRNSPSYEGTQSGSAKQGQTVYIAAIAEVPEKHSIWGEVDRQGSGKWICILDDDYVYLN